MIIKFPENTSVSTALKVAEYLEKQKIDFELIMGDKGQVSVTPDIDPDDFHPDDLAPPREIEDTRVKQTIEQNDPLWRPGRFGSGHESCLRDCKDIIHYGAEAI